MHTSKMIVRKAMLAHLGQHGADIHRQSVQYSEAKGAADMVERVAVWLESHKYKYKILAASVRRQFLPKD